jgi:hypothetical protein
VTAIVWFDKPITTCFEDVDPAAFGIELAVEHPANTATATVPIPS